MATRHIRIGSAEDVFSYDDTDFDAAIETDHVIKAGTPSAANDVLRLGDISIATAWPIGSVFLSVVATNPATLLGFGTWSQIAEGQMLTGFKTGDADFGTVEATGGNKTVAHDNNHSGAAVGAHVGADSQAGTGAAIKVFENADDLVHSVTQPDAHSDHNILNPFFVIYVWKRTA